MKATITLKALVDGDVDDRGQEVVFTHEFSTRGARTVVITVGDVQVELRVRDLEAALAALAEIG